MKCSRRKIVNESIKKFLHFVDVKNIETNNVDESSNETKSKNVEIKNFVFCQYLTNLTNRTLQIFLKIDLSII